MMRYVFRTTEHPNYDWYEKTAATPSMMSSGAGFLMKDFRSWFMKWVFK